MYWCSGTASLLNLYSTNLQSGVYRYPVNTTACCHGSQVGAQLTPQPLLLIGTQLKLHPLLFIGLVQLTSTPQICRVLRIGTQLKLQPLLFTGTYHDAALLAHAEGALYGTELGSVTLKRIGFFSFPIKHSLNTHTQRTLQLIPGHATTDYESDHEFPDYEFRFSQLLHQ